MGKKLVWKRIWARKYAPFLASAFIWSYLKNKQFGTGPNKMFVPEGSLSANYWEAGEFKKLSRNYERFLRKQNLKKYAKVYEREFQDYLNFMRKVAAVNPVKLTTRELSSLVERLNKRIVQSSDYQFYAFLVLEGPVADLERRLSRLPNSQQILQWVTTPYQETKIARARTELLELVKNKKLHRLKSYTQQYAWIPIYEPLDKPWSETDFRKQAKSIKNPGKELVEYRQHRREFLARYKKFLTGVKDSKLRKQIEIVHAFSYLKEMRDDYRRHAYYLLRPFLQKLAQRLGISFVQLNYLTSDELLESVKKENCVVSKRELSDRQKAYALVLQNARLKILSGKQALELGAKVLQAGGERITGSPAFRGLVRGRACIVYHQGESKKFKSGQILVTTMTHPEFLPIMKKAKAIVTDEGGITCHAAIVSRELGIPCVIGTKIATRVLKDGDMVEVDANKGVVRKI